MVAAIAAAGILLGACGSGQPTPQNAAAVQSATSSAATSSAAPSTPAPSTAAPTSAPPSTSVKPAPTTEAKPKPTTTTPKPAPVQPAESKPKPEQPVTLPGAPCAATAKACIDLSENKAWLMEGGNVVYGPVPITSGRKGYLTPPGTFNVTFKNRHHKSSLFNDAPMPWSVFFNGGIAFHQGSLREKSHGCIHLSPAAAQKFFGSLAVGDVVQVVP